jgi:hypothetical protein
MSTNPTSPNIITDVQTTPDGKYEITTTTAVQTTTVVKPIGPKPPLIPSNAIIYANLEMATNWKGEKDMATAGAATDATGTTKYPTVLIPSPPTSREFRFTNKVKGAGWRWSNSFGKNSKPTNFAYCLDVYCTDWTKIMNLELDMNQVMADGRTCMLCVQSASGSKTWEYTTTPSGGAHWNKSNLSSNLQLWPAKTWKSIKIYSHRDSAGIVYYDGVEEDGVYSAFQNASGISSLSLGWGANTLLLNFQVEGNVANGAADLFVKNLDIYAW